MKATLLKQEPQVSITMSLEQAKILKELVRYNIDNLTIPGFLIRLNLPQNANEILAKPLYNQLHQIL